MVSFTFTFTTKNYTPFILRISKTASWTKKIIVQVGLAIRGLGTREYIIFGPAKSKTAISKRKITISA